MSKYSSVAAVTCTSFACFRPAVSAARVFDSHAASTGIVTPRATAWASAYVTRGRRRHTRHVESVTLPSCTSGNWRSRNVFTPRIVPANLSVM